MPWFRVDSDWWMTDWLVCLSSEAKLAWILLIGHVKANGEKGRAKALAPQVAARVWMVGEESVRQMLIAAEAAGAIVRDDSDWTITKWKDYQTDPTHAERQAGYRDRKKTSTTSDSNVTSRHGDIRHVPKVTPTGQDNTGQERTIQDNQKSCAPDLVDVVEFASQIGKSQEDAARFYGCMSADGWQVSGESVRNWKGLFRTWVPPLRVEHGGKAPSLTVEEAERIREGGPTPGSESPFAKLKRELAEGGPA